MKTKRLAQAIFPVLMSSLLGLAVLPAGAADTHAPVSKIDQPQAGYQHFRVGSVRVTALSDGTVPITPETLMTRAKPGLVAARLADHFHGHQVDISVNAYLIETAGRLILVDAGTGDLYGPTLDKLPRSLAAIGYRPEQITDILVTHIHADHTGGLMRGKEMVYPNATLHMERRELDYWLSPAERAKAAPAERKSFDAALAKVKPYADAGKVKTFSGAVQLFPGIRSLPTPGHTPGHSLYSLESGGEKLVFLGDLLHVAEVQMPHPEVTISFDVDQSAAALQRKKVFADAAKGRYLVAADHIAFPGLGRLRAEGQGYRFVPAPYVNDAVAP